MYRVGYIRRSFYKNNLLTIKNKNKSFIKSSSETILTLWSPGAVNVAFLATKTACVIKSCQKGNKNGFTSRFYW